MPSRTTPLPRTAVVTGAAGGMGAALAARLVAEGVRVLLADLDVAVLAVPGTDGPTLGFDDTGRTKQPAAALGYPQDGPYDAQPVRVRTEQKLRSPDIYGDGSVTREVFSLRGTIRPGNSGGPLVATSGKVLGVV